MLSQLNSVQARRQREIEEGWEEEERANRAAQELGAQIEADMLAKELQYKARKRADSEATDRRHLLAGMAISIR